jgi:hypothetical protein
MEDEGVETARITIVTMLRPDGEIWTEYELSDNLPEANALGMLTRTAHEIMHDCRDREED